MDESADITISGRKVQECVSIPIIWECGTGKFSNMHQSACNLKNASIKKEKQHGEN